MGLRFAIHVRYSDSDKMGIVHHAAYIPWFEAGRVELMRACGIPYDEVEERGFAFPVLKLSIQYRKPAHFDERLELETSYAEVTRSRVRFLYQLFNAEQHLVAEGSTEHACLNSQGRPCRLPKWILNCLELPTENKPSPDQY